MADTGWNIEAVRRHFDFTTGPRTVTNNAASTQAPRALLQRLHTLAADYENVHRGQSGASQRTTQRFEAAYDDIAAFVGARSRREVVVTRNTTEAHNLVMHALMPDFRDGDNLVTTMLEHNSNYVPWHALAREILPRLGRRVELRLARFDPATGELDLDHLASLVDSRTKLVCCTGASNFLGTKPPLDRVREIATAGGYAQPDGERGAYLLVDGAQLVPGQAVDVQAMGIDFLSFSFHKMLAPFGCGALVAKEHLLQRAAPFLYGGDMVADGGVWADRVDYGPLPWKFAAGTPNILGTIVSADALRLLLDLALAPGPARFFGSTRPITPADVGPAMQRVQAWNRALTGHAIERLLAVPGLRLHGPRSAARRSSLVAFNVDGHDPLALARGLDRAGVEARAGCHCAALAHRALALEPLASCRLSFYLYNTLSEVDRAVDALQALVAPRVMGATAARHHRASPVDAA